VTEMASVNLFTVVFCTEVHDISTCPATVQLCQYATKNGLNIIYQYLLSYLFNTFRTFQIICDATHYIMISLTLLFYCHLTLIQINSSMVKHT